MAKESLWLSLGTPTCSTHCDETPSRSAVRLGLDHTLGLVVHRVKQHLAVDACSIYLVDASGTGCILMATDGLDPKAVGRMQLGRREGLVGVVLESGEPTQHDKRAATPAGSRYSRFGGEVYHSFLGVPIIYYREVLGVLAVRQTNDRTFTGAEEAFLLTLAAELAGLQGSKG